MGQRAHNRRHEGRRIRREQRELRRAFANLPTLSAQFAELGRVMAEVFSDMVEQVSAAMKELGDVFMAYQPPPRKSDYYAPILPELEPLQLEPIELIQIRETDPECKALECAPDAHTFRGGTPL